MPRCSEVGCFTEATRCVEVEADPKQETSPEKPGLAGFFIPACEERAPTIREDVEHICDGEPVGIRVVPIQESSYPPAVSWIPLYRRRQK